MKTILNATDYSERSVAALKYAYSLSKAIGAQLKVIHIFDYPTLLDELSLKAQDPFPDIEGDAFRKHNLKLNNFCKEHLGTDLEKLNVTVEAIEDKSVVNGIISKANKIKPLLIIMGVKGGSVLREIIMGNTTMHLLEKSPCPILSIPEDTSRTKIETIIYATAFEEEDLGAINKLTEIAEPLNAKIKIVHVSSLKKSQVGIEEKKEIEDKIHKYITYSNIELDIIYSDAVFEDLKIYFGKANADIIAMLECEDNGGFSKIFHRDLVKKMESYGRIPLMSFNAKNYGIFHL
ncbi:universal stress protein [Psychroserpens sp. AS72]|uniref:universal stress protein n=1 Tax=Psychroserpens sp. AS72 TaxID=3135775 RepID=UPI00316EB64E